MKAYKSKLLLTALAYAAALAILMYVMTYSAVIGIIGILVLGLSVRTPIEKIRESELESVIFDELDPEKFNELLSLGVFKKSKRHQVLAAVSLGEHDKALEMIGNKGEKKQHPVEICNDLYRKGYIHFERGEFDKLPAVVKEYNELKKKFPQFVTVFENFSVFDKFDAFADEDYEYVIDVCDIDLKELDLKKQNAKVTKVNVSFYRAVSLYKLGRFEEAKKGFEDIISFAPKMNKAKLSKEYIELIDSGK